MKISPDNTPGEGPTKVGETVTSPVPPAAEPEAAKAEAKAAAEEQKAEEKSPAVAPTSQKTAPTEEPELDAPTPASTKISKSDSTKAAVKGLKNLLASGNPEDSKFWFCLKHPAARMLICVVLMFLNM